MPRSHRPLLPGVCCSGGKPWAWRWVSGYLVLSFNVRLFISQWTNLTAQRVLPSLQSTLMASDLCIFQDGRASLIRCFKSGLEKTMGGLSPSSRFLQHPLLTITLFVPFRVPLLFPLWMSAFFSALFIPATQIWLCVGATHVHAELSQHGRVPGARLHHQQITPSPQPHYSPSETCVYKLCHDKSPGNFLCCWQLHTHAFPFSCKKNPFPAPTQDRRSVISTPTAHRRCIFRKIHSPLKSFTTGPFPSPSPCLTPSSPTPSVAVNLKACPTATHPTSRRLCSLRNFSSGSEGLPRGTHEFSRQQGKVIERDAWGQELALWNRVPWCMAEFLLSWWSWAAFLSSLPAFPRLLLSNRKVIISQEEMYIQAPCKFPVLGCFMGWCSLLYDRAKGPFSDFPWMLICLQKPWVKIKYIKLGRRWSGHLLFLLLPIHANSTPFPFQEITSSSFCAFQRISSPALGDCQSSLPSRAVGLLSKLGRLDSPF